MKVAIVAPEAVPFATGGAERLCEGLRAAIVDAGHDAELITIPTPERSFRQLIDSYEAFGQLDLSSYDRVISTKYPSWMVRHQEHVVYMLHTLRGLYDSYHYFGLSTVIPPLGEAGHGLLGALAAAPGSRDGWRNVIAEARDFVDRTGDEDPLCVFPGPLIRAVVHWLDRDALSPANIRYYAAISRTVARRPDYFPSSAKVEVHLPPTNMSGLVPGPFRSFFTASRLDQPKRIELLIEAMGYVEQAVDLRIAGSGPDEERLKAVRPHDQRIKFLGRLTETELATEYSNALAVPFVPYDEDFGLVTLEAQLAGKPVLTCADSGGVTELVSDRVTGRIVEPDPASIGAALSELARSVEGARLMGAKARESALRITWETVVDGLLGRPAVQVNSGIGGTRAVPKVLVLSTYAAEPAFHGGQVRLNRLICGLSKHFRVELIALDHSVTSVKISDPLPNFRQFLVPRSEKHMQHEAELAARSPIPIGDLASALFAQQNPALLSTIKERGHDACGAILEQPYMLPALKLADAELPFVYGSQNAETDMKAAMVCESANGANLIAIVETVERAAVRGAELISACSTEDIAALGRLGPTLADWALVPNGSDVRVTEFVTGTRRRTLRRVWLSNYAKYAERPVFERVALFVGSYHQPNLEAAEFIVRHAHEMPDVGFFLAGSLEIHFERWRLPPNVIVAGRVTHTELRQLLAVADVALNPVVTGGGTNLKLIDYFAAGAPVVSTPLGTRGTGLIHGKELLIADRADFVAAIRMVLNSPADADIRAGFARELAERDYDWGPIGDAFAGAVGAAFGVED